MISQSPTRLATKIEQLSHFLNGPTPHSLLDPSPKRNSDDRPVYATRQPDGSFRLYARTSVPPIGQPSERKGDLGAFLAEVLAELRTHNRQGAHQLMGRMQKMLQHREWHASPPTVRELRWLNADLDKALKAASDPTPEQAAFRQRARSRVAISTFQKDLDQRLRTLPKDDPQRDALTQAGRLLLDMLVQPSATLSLKGLAVDTIHWLHDSGLLTRFANLRDGMEPPLERLIAPEAAQHLLDPLQLPTIRTLMLV